MSYECYDIKERLVQVLSRAQAPAVGLINITLLHPLGDPNHDANGNGVP